MARVMVVSLPWTRGDVNPYLAVTGRLLREGHDVMWLSLPTDLGGLEADVRAAGVTVLPTPPLSCDPFPRGAALASAFADPPRCLELMRKIASVVPEQVDPVRAHLREVQPDVLMCDRTTQLLSAVVAAEKEGVPYACIAASLMIVARMRPPAPDSPLAELGPLLRDLTHRLIASYDTPLAFANSIWISRWATTMFTTREFLGDDVEVAPEISLIGPCLAPPPATPSAGPPFPWERLRQDGRIVYVSFGSLYRDARLYALFAQAASALDVQLVVALPEDMSRDGLPGDAIVVSSTPQMELLSKVRAFVTHGGLNSVNEALFHGVPLVVVPFATDQWNQAHFVAKNGAGVALEGRELTLDACRDALAAALDDAAIRAAARRIQASFRATDAIGAACERLVALAERRRAEPASG